MRRLSIIIFAVAMVLILGCGVSMAAELTIKDHYHTDENSTPEITVTYDTDDVDAALKVWVNDLLVIDKTVKAGASYSEKLTIGEWNSLGAQEGKYTIKATLESADFKFEKSATLYADWNPPVISNPNPADNAFVSSLTSFSVTITDAGTGVDKDAVSKDAVSLEVSAGGTTVSGISGPQIVGDRYTWTIPQLTDGTYTFKVTAPDSVPLPNTHTAEKTFTVTLDKTKPTVSITQRPNDTTDNSPANTGFEWTVTETNPAQYTVLVNGVEAFSISHDEAFEAGMITDNAFTFNGDTNGDGKQDVFLENGEYTVVLKVKDKAGNEGESEEWTFVFDNTAPEYTAGALPAYVGPNTEFTLTFKDAVAGFEGGEDVLVWAYGPDNELIGSVTIDGTPDDERLLTVAWADIVSKILELVEDPSQLDLEDGDRLTIKVLAYDRLGNPDDPSGSLEDEEKEDLAAVLTSTWDATEPEISGLPTSDARCDITRVKLLYKVADELSGLSYAELAIGDESYNTGENSDIIYFVPDGVEINLASLFGEKLVNGNNYTLSLTVYDAAGNSKGADSIAMAVLVMDEYIEYSLQGSTDIEVDDEVIAVSRYSRPQIYVDYPTDLQIQYPEAEFSIDGTPITSQSIIVSTVGDKCRITIVPPYDLADGIHELKVSVRVPDEQFISYDGTFKFGVDTTSPAATQITEDWDGASPVKVQVSDNLSGVSSVEMGIADRTAMLPATQDPENPNVFSIKFGQTFAEGTYTLIVAYVDNMGNQGQKAFTLTVGAPPAPVEDKVAPEIKCEIKDGVLNITATDDVDLDRIVVTVDGKSETLSVSGTNITWPYVLPTKIGLYSIQVVAYDKAGNASAPWTTTYKVRPKYEPGKSSGFGWDMWKN